MSGKSGEKETGRKPTSSKRHDAKTDGAFGKENIEQTETGEELNVDMAVAKRVDKEES